MAQNPQTQPNTSATASSPQPTAPTFPDSLPRPNLRTLMLPMAILIHHHHHPLLLPSYANPLEEGPVFKPATIRTVLSLAMGRKWPIHQFDVKNAFLHGNLHETVYMYQPPGFFNPSYSGHVFKLHKSLYGLKHAPRAWYQRFAQHLFTLGFTCSKSDTSLFIFRRCGECAYLLLYVDDIILTTSSSSLKTEIITALNREFEMTDLGVLSYFLGISVKRNSNGMFLTQQKYTEDILKREKMENCKPIATPVDTNSKLSAIVGEPMADPSLYRSLARALQYLTFTRSDIAYALK
ncbi:hypothetical protein OSB04_021136 [Centaurea solstitialis]|uniref:Reverse transcriptase Ty1/copia-type domain-containing protein n=1 Tax=Centaurea solstitialis TaxID=347529 RepID=A0AA38STZ5_9ASTR|nr:hypothetical protein OSB04_021136 [Centaurea solstitialis]